VGQWDDMETEADDSLERSGALTCMSAREPLPQPNANSIVYEGETHKCGIEVPTGLFRAKEPDRT
jgi:hypothetical protein